MESFIYIGFTNGASYHTQNLASASWAIYIPTSQVLSLGGVCLRPSSNNVVEYSAIIDLFHDSISRGTY